MKGPTSASNLSYGREKSNSDMKRYCYPKLTPFIELGNLRIGGPGLANCLFVVTRAYIETRTTGCVMLAPAWLKLSIGPMLRRERDKRVYAGLFNRIGIGGIRKLLLTSPLNPRRKHIVKFSSLGNYFSDFNRHRHLVAELLGLITKPSTIALVDEKRMSRGVAMHVRLGDYNDTLRIPTEWYAGVARNIRRINPSIPIFLFSDGTDDELRPLTTLPGVERIFCGNAFADMQAISRCLFTVASDSTFSAWGAFMGGKPILFSRRHFPAVYCGDVAEAVIGNSTELPPEFVEILEKAR